MAELLSDDQVAEASERLPGWHREEGALVRQVELADFPQAIAVVDRVAEIAEDHNHHPDIDIRWRTLTFRCSTHVAGGITALDVALAGRISEVLEALPTGG